MHLYIFGLKYLNTLSVPGFDFCEFFFSVFLKKKKKQTNLRSVTVILRITGDIPFFLVFSVKESQFILKLYILYCVEIKMR